MNSLRSRQKRNDYSSLEESLRDDPSFMAAPFDSQVIAIEAKALIDGELRMLRSNPNDISSGLQEVRYLRRSGTRPPHVQAELFAIESIYLKQMATLAALDNNLHDANQLQQAAMNALLHAMKLRGEDASKEMWCARRFRMMALGARCMPQSLATYSPHDLKLAESMARDSTFPDALLQLVDVELAKERPSRFAERVMHDVELSLETVGYMQDHDFSVGVAARRRWWELRFHLKEPLRHDLLKKDIEFFRKIGMNNELRGLQLASIRNPDARELVLELLKPAK